MFIANRRVTAALVALAAFTFFAASAPVFAANGVVEPIHDRMPVILDPASYDGWLLPPAQGGPELMAAFQALSEELLEMYPVSPLVNKAGVEDPRCLEPARPATLW